MPLGEIRRQRSVALSWDLPDPKGVLITDFDGTVTERDFYLLIVERYMTPDAMLTWDEYREGKMTHFQAMQTFFSHTPENEEALHDLLRDTEPDPAFAKAAASLREAGWDLTIVSAGSSWYIERILRSAGVEATIHSNPGKIVPGKGLVMELATGAPFFCPEVGINKGAVVEDALRRYKQVAFAGDGPPDLKPALMVSPDSRFARGFLAEELQRRRERFSGYTVWSDIVYELLR